VKRSARRYSKTRKRLCILDRAGEGDEERQGIIVYSMMCVISGFHREVDENCAPLGYIYIYIYIYIYVYIYI
jgi:hypothetical protein